jgi:hypothetical protein
MNNYIPDQNRFKLTGPPSWWLRHLWEFDSSLVVIPSRQDCVYRLAQRRQPDLRANITNDALWNMSDTQMLASYSLIPVTTIIATANWSNPLMWEDLRQRAPWRNGGADAVIKHIEGNERKKELDIAAKNDAYNDYLAKDAWRYYEMKQGLRSNVYSPKTPDRRPKIASKAPLIQVATR